MHRALEMALRYLFRSALLVCLAAFGVAGAGVFAQSKSADRAHAAALALDQQGRTEEAEAAWRAILKGHPHDAEALAQVGVHEARQEHYTEAITYYREALAVAPAFPQLELNLGLAYFKAKRFQEAIPCFAHELHRHPGDLRLTILLGMSHYGAGDYAGAVPWLQKAADRDSNNLTLRMTLAQSCLWSKQPQCVMDDYKKILEIDPNSAPADMLAGEALDQMGDNAGALAQFEAAVKANPKEPNVHFGLAYLLMTQKRFSDAVPEYRVDLENDPSHAQARVYLADCYLHLEDNEHAQPELERALKDDPRIELGHLDLGIIYAAEGRNEEAMAQYLAAIKLNPKDSDPHWRLSRLYQAMGQTEKARTEAVLVSRMKKQAYQSLYDQISGAGNARHAAEVANPPQ